MEKTLNYIAARLREPSTWRGLMLILTAFGVHINPEMQNAITTIGLGAAGSIGVLIPDPK